MITWAIGTRLDPYVLISPIGAGGMGEVWKARDARLDRVVAIKRLKGAHSSRFKREARAIAALNHPHICQLYDIGPDYLVMEYIDTNRFEVLYQRKRPSVWRSRSQVLSSRRTGKGSSIAI
jgi:serine/threonine protein kinase